MKNVTEFLKEAFTFQKFAAKRGYELMMASGCKLKMYKTPDSFEFEEHGVVITFRENTTYNFPDYKYICLKKEELERTDEEWSVYIEQVKKLLKNKKRSVRKKIVSGK